MADNIRDVYSVVFTSLGEEKLIQQLNRVKKAADDMTHSLAKIQSLQGMNVEAGANSSKLKSALKAVMDNEKIKQAAILKTEEVILKSDIKRIATDQKVADSLANNSLKFIALKQKETQAKIDVVKNRLIKNYGYCDICATDALHFVASIFARGDVRRT